MNLVSTPTIVHAEAGDFPTLRELLSTVGLPQDGLDEHTTMAVVARAGDKIVGSAALEIYGSSALLRSVAVLPTAQGQGLGQRLVEAALHLADDRQIHHVYLLTETAVGYFPRFGFRIVLRHEVDPAIQQSVEFTSACPASATVMVKGFSSQ